MHWYTDVLKKYATFEGRASRAEFWWFMLINYAIIMVWMIPSFIFLAQAESSGGAAVMAGIFWAIFGIYILALILPSLAVSARRLHDTDHSGWFLLIQLIPYVGGIALFVFMVLDGTPGPNRYGEDPKDRQSLGQPSQQLAGQMYAPGQWPQAGGVGEATGSAGMSGAQFRQKLEKTEQLHTAGILNEREYVERRRDIIASLANTPTIGTPEEFMLAIVPMVDQGSLSQDELDIVKRHVLHLSAASSTPSHASTPTHTESPDEDFGMSFDVGTTGDDGGGWS